MKMLNGLSNRTRPLILSAGVLIALTFVGFGGWAALAPLARGAVASAVVVAEGERKTVQHLEGGLVKEILIKDGDVVKLGQTLLVLDEVQPKAKLESLTARSHSEEALIARLRAERDDAKDVHFPEKLMQLKTAPRVAEILQGERNLFKTRAHTRSTETNLMAQQQAQYQKKVDGIKEQISAFKEQQTLIEHELQGLEKLFKKGLTKRTRILELQRKLAEIKGKRASLVSDGAQAEIRINESKLRLVRQQATQREQIIAELREAEDRLFKVEEELHSIRDILRRVEIKAPQGGMVHDLKVHTPGGVIRAGDDLMDIVPLNDHLILEAKIQPLDIDHVQIATKGEIRFPGLPQRTTPVLKGQVLTVSPDVLKDEKTGDSYYLAKVGVSPEERTLMGEIALPPGMPADVILKSGERTVLEYILEPLRSAVAKSFME